MLLVARDNRSGNVVVHYLPEGARIRALGFEVERNGNGVFIHLANQSIRVESPGSLNLTDVVFTFVPVSQLLGRIEAEPERVIHDLERLTFEEDVPNAARRFLRLYAALLGLRHFDTAPDAVRESLVLTVARLTGRSPEEIITGKGEVEAELTREVQAALESMSSEELSYVFTVLGVR